MSLCLRYLLGAAAAVLMLFVLAPGLLAARAATVAVTVTHDGQKIGSIPVRLLGLGFDKTQKTNRQGVASFRVNRKGRYKAIVDVSEANRRLTGEASLKVGNKRHYRTAISLKEWRTDATLSGLVTFEGLAVGKATVLASTPTNDYVATTDSDGRYEFLSLPAGTYTVSVSSLGRQPQENSITLEAGDSLTLNFQLQANPAPGNVQVVNVDRSGEGQGGTAENQDVTWERVVDAVGYLVTVNGYEQPTVSEPRYEARSLTPNTVYSYEVKAVYDEEQGIYSEKSAAAARRTQKRPSLRWLNPTSGKALEGQQTLNVSYSTGCPVEWANSSGVLNGPMTVHTSALTQSWDTKTVANGRYTLTATLKDVEGNEASASVNFDVLNKGGLKGTVTVLGLPVANATVKVGQFTKTTDANGRYEVTGLRPREYTVRVTAAGLNSHAETVQVTENVIRTVNVALVDSTPPAVASQTLEPGRPSAWQLVQEWTKPSDPTGIGGYELRLIDADTNLLVATKSVGANATSQTWGKNDGVAANSSYRAEIQATDGAGNTGSWESSDEAYTQALPKGEWVAPEANAELRGPTNLEVSFQAWGVNNPVSQIELWVDGIRLLQKPWDSRSGTYQRSWDSETVINGNHSLKLTVKDSEENIVTVERTVRVANPPPFAVTIIGAPDCDAHPVRVGVNAQGGLAYLARLEVFYERADNGAIQLVRTVDFPAYTQEFVGEVLVRESLPEDTTGLLRVRATDGEGRRLADDVAVAVSKRPTYRYTGRSFSTARPMNLAVRDGRLYVGKEPGQGARGIMVVDLSNMTLERAINVGRPNFLAHDYGRANTLLAADFGHSIWVSSRREGNEWLDAFSDGPSYLFTDLSSMAGGPTILCVTATVISVLENGQRTGRWEMENVLPNFNDTAGDGAWDPFCNRLWLSVSNEFGFHNRIRRVDWENPNGSVLDVVIGYDAQEVAKAPGRDVLLVAASGLVHVLASGSLSEYATFPVPSDKRITGMAFDASTGRCYVSVFDDWVVYEFEPVSR